MKSGTFPSNRTGKIQICRLSYWWYSIVWGDLPGWLFAFPLKEGQKCHSMLPRASVSLFLASKTNVSPSTSREETLLGQISRSPKYHKRKSSTAVWIQKASDEPCWNVNCLTSLLFGLHQAWVWAYQIQLGKSLYSFVISSEELEGNIHSNMRISHS